MIPYYSDSAVTLFHGDYLDFTGEAGVSDHFDLIVTDPPYGETSLPWDQWVRDWPNYAADLAPSMWCFGSMRMFLEHREDFRDWKFSQDVVWEKHNGSGFHADRFRRVHEHAIFWYRRTWALTYHDPQTTPDATARTVRSKRRPAHMGRIERTPYVSVDNGPRLMTSVLYAPSMHGEALHPTEKPQAILDPLIRYGCPPGGTVLDPFAGSGSTLLAARSAGRHAVGVEIDEQFCELAARRLSQGVLDFGDAS